MIANAAAVGQPGALAFATASAVQQSAAGSSASDSVTNALGAHITAAASAAASGENGALAIAHALGVAQGAFASTSHFQTVVHGTADIHKTTAGTTIFGGTATAATRTFTFAPSGPATVSLDNSGTIDVSANASAVNSLGGPAVGATFTSPAFAWATAVGVVQGARGTSVDITADNSGTISVSAGAAALGGVTSAAAFATATGIAQHGNAVAFHATINSVAGTVTGTTFFGHPFTYTTLIPTATATSLTNVGPVNLTVNNSGLLDVSAVANANAGTFASALAFGLGVSQGGSGTVVTESVDNSGTITVAADANATGGTSAFAAAGAVGVGQFAEATTANLSIVNSGHVTVTANAVANAVHGDRYRHGGYDEPGRRGQGLGDGARLRSDRLGDQRLCERLEQRHSERRRARDGGRHLCERIRERRWCVAVG